MNKTVDVFPALVLDLEIDENPDVVEMLVILDQRQTVEHYHTQVRAFPRTLFGPDLKMNDTFKITITTEPGKIHHLFEKHEYPMEMWEKPDYFEGMDLKFLFEKDDKPE